MAIYKNNVITSTSSTPEEAGDLIWNRQVFDFANATYKPTTVANADQIEIGVVPAGCVLVPSLSRLTIPQIDSNGAPTGTYSIGTAAQPAALKAAGTLASTAGDYFGKDLLIPLTTQPIGAADVNTPVYLTFGANVATLVASGKTVFEMVIRPYLTQIEV